MTAPGAFPVDGPGTPLPAVLDLTDDDQIRALHLKLDYLIEMATRAEALANKLGAVVESIGSSGPQAAMLKALGLNLGGLRG